MGARPLAAGRCRYTCIASVGNGRHAGGMFSRVRWLQSGERTARERLNEDLLFALLIIPLLSAVLVATGAQRDRVITMLLVWTGLGTGVAVIRFLMRSR